MIGTFIKRPVFTTMLVMLLVVFGLQSYPTLGIDLNPDVDFPLVTVSVTYTGASPEEMESLVTKPIEDAVSSMAGIKTLSSISREGLSQTTIEFELGTNSKQATQDVREKVAGVRRRLPDQADDPVVQRFDITAQAVLSFSLASDARSRSEVYKIAVDTVKDELQRIDGVAEVGVYGATDREIQIITDPKKLEAYNITLQQIMDTVNSQNMNTPGGRVTSKTTELTVRTLGQFKSIDDVKNIVVANQQGRLIKLNDVAKIVDTFAEERSFARTNGVPSVMLSVQKQSGTNTVEVAERVKQALERMKNQNIIPPDVQPILVRDSSVYIRSSVEDAMSSMLFGGLLAIVITFLFLRDWRATVIGALAIPTSIISTFFLMKSMNFTLNTMSLMGLSLAVGILIDDAIVIIENIARHIELGKTPMQAALEGTQEISLAVMATTFSILAVFVPVGSMGEIVGQFFKQFGLTVAFSVAFSLFVAFTLTPTLSAYWLKKPGEAEEKYKKRFTWIYKPLDMWENAFIGLRNIYEYTIRWALNRPKMVVAAAIVSLVVNVALVQFLGKEFQPTYDSGEFSIMLTAPPGTSMEQMKQLIQPVEEVVLQIPEKDAAYMAIGTNRQSINKATIGIRLVPSDQRKRSMMTVMDDLRTKLRNVNGLKVTITTNQGGGRGDSRPIQLALRGPELNILNQFATDVAEKVKKIPGATDVDISSDQAEPEVQIKLDKMRAGDVGIDATTAGNLIQMALIGQTSKNKYNASDNDYNIRVQIQQQDRVGLNDIANLRLTTKTGAFVRLGDIAEIKLSSGPTQVDREDRQRQVIVYANNVGASQGEVVSQVQNIMNETVLPSGYSYKFVGQADMMQKSFMEIVKALGLAIIMIYMVLAAEFESFIHPFTIMLSIPFSIVGAILGLMVAGQTLNIMSFIGVIMLMGLVTKNAILLVDYANQLIAEGVETKEALIQAGTVRLRPIMMTTMAMIFGMLPVALGIGSGAELRQSMAVAVIGGLITSTFLTLVIVPLVYLLIDRAQKWFKKLDRGSGFSVN